MAFLGDFETTFASVIEWLQLHHASKQNLIEMVALFFESPNHFLPPKLSMRGSSLHTYEGSFLMSCNYIPVMLAKNHPNASAKKRRSRCSPFFYHVLAPNLDNPPPVKKNEKHLKEEFRFPMVDTLKRGKESCGMAVSNNKREFMQTPQPSSNITIKHTYQLGIFAISISTVCCGLTGDGSEIRVQLTS